MNCPVQPSQFEGIRPGQVWSLWDMINYQVFGLIGWLKLFDQERRVMGEKLQMLAVLATISREDAEKIPAGAYIVTQGDKQRIEGMLGYAEQLCQQLDLTGTKNRVERFQRCLKNAALTPLTLQNELQVLYDALEDDLRYKYFYFYPDAKAKPVLRVDIDWEDTFKAFKSAKDDGKAAVDCYGLGHNTACVFHCMRVLEHGIKALAANVGLTFDVQQWKNIIDEIEAKIDRMRDNGIPGLDKAAKDARLQFLSEAAKEFFYFKDGWRNYVSHNHAAYDENQALSVLEHTRAFMNHLASQLSEPA